MAAPGAALRAQQIAEEAEAHFARADASGAPPTLFIPRSGAVALRNPNVGFEYSSLEEAFPAVDPGLAPVGSVVLVQYRLMPLRTPGGLRISDDERATQHDNEQVAKVIAVGALAFRDRTTFEPWPEGAWFKPGDFVRVPKYQGDQFQVDIERADREPIGDTGRWRETTAHDKVRFALFKDLAIFGVYTGDPLKIRTFL